MTQNIAQLDFNNLEFKYAYDLIMNTRESVFLTGKAGTGKSTFLRVISQELEKPHVVLAPTGIAAINVKGETIHSFFQLPIGPMLPGDKRLQDLKMRKNKINLIKKLKLIIIDEASMLRSDIMDAIDRILRQVTGYNNSPFGGKQLLLVGDLFQLEPVVRGEEKEILSQFYNTSYFFGAQVFKELNLVNIELQKVYRQADQQFIDLLNNIRNGEPSRENHLALNEQVNPYFKPPEDDLFITLTTTRKIADSTNRHRLESLAGEEQAFEGTIEGDFPVKTLPTDQNLRLKEGAQVMFIKNDSGGNEDQADEEATGRRWVNGTLATVKEMGDNMIKVELRDGQEHTIERAIWENIKYEYDPEENRIQENVLGSFTQYPLKLAWAVTIHKSQGLTFDKVFIDLGHGAFAAGQLYVALSRCTSMEGIILRYSIKNRDLILRPEVLRFYETMNDRQWIERLLKDAGIEGES